MSPRVTVIIPTYNWSTVLPYSIGSVLDQTFTDFELLVIGDGCTDDSEAVVRGISDPRVRWIGIGRTGHQSGPMNEGLRQAGGEFIAYLGHDDLWLAHHLMAGLAELDRGADLTHSLLLFVLPKGDPEIRAPAPALPPSCVMHRRSLMEKLGGWRDLSELSVAPDLDLFSRAAAAGFEFRFVPRLTGVKFPAALRRNVYLERPSHEQAAWLTRIRAEPDFEPIELAKVAARTYRAPSFSRRLWILATTPSRWRAFLWRRGGARLRLEQRFKGIR